MGQESGSADTDETEEYGEEVKDSRKNGEKGKQEERSERSGEERGKRENGKNEVNNPGKNGEKGKREGRSERSVEERGKRENGKNEVNNPGKNGEKGNGKEEVKDPRKNGKRENGKEEVKDPRKNGKRENGKEEVNNPWKNGDKNPGRSGKKKGGGKGKDRRDGKSRKRTKSTFLPEPLIRAKAFMLGGKDAPQASGTALLARDALWAFIIVGIIISATLLYTQRWPPVVVVESGSMQHPDETAPGVYESQDDYSSKLGVIDTGDLVLVKKIHGREDVITYAEATNRSNPNHGHETYGNPGDVIIYRKNGLDDTPVIHRAIVWIERNETRREEGLYWDVPDWGLWGVESIGTNDDPIYLPGIKLYISFTPTRSYSGFLTCGDNRQTNFHVDQQTHRDKLGNPVNQVRAEWVLGVARGEIPWFGYLKLKTSGNPGADDVPDNSRKWMWTTIVLIISTPIILELVVTAYYKLSGKEKKEETEERGKKKGGGTGGKGRGGRKKGRSPGGGPGSGSQGGKSGRKSKK